MIDEMIDTASVILFYILTTATGIAVVAALYSLIVVQSDCIKFGELTGAKVDYSITTGCYVTMPDGRILKKEAAEEKSLGKLDYKK